MEKEKNRIEELEKKVNYLNRLTLKFDKEYKACINDATIKISGSFKKALNESDVQKKLDRIIYVLLVATSVSIFTLASLFFLAQ